MTNPTDLKELLLNAGAYEVGNQEDPQSLYDFKVSPRHRIHMAFDQLLPEATFVTVALVTIDREYSKDGHPQSSIDAHRIGQWSVEEFASFLGKNGSFLAKLLPLADPRQFLFN